MNQTLRYKDIDIDTRVGFNYIKQQYYVTNKQYTTYRTTLEQIREVLNALEISATDVTDEELLSFKEDIEYLHKVSYTIQDTGAYIHTLQFNDFSKYPLTIDCEKAKLYIMNSPIVYDLTLNESPRNIRIPRILAFYKDTLGLLISTEDMRYFYSLLVSYYYPTPYNQVEYETDTKKYFYNNKFILSNYSNTSNATYICTCNPNNTASGTTVGTVSSTDTSSNSIILTEPILKETLQGYNTITLHGATTYIATVDTTYSSDGTYTIESIEDNTIRVKETIPYAYEFPYKECYVVGAEYTVTDMQRDNYTITLSETPTTLLIGDAILISGAEVTTQYETISCNGTYTIQSIEDNTITVVEPIPTDFTGEALLIKETFIGNIASIKNKKITLLNTMDKDLTNSIITIHTIGDTNTNIESYTVSAYTNKTITVVESISNYKYTDTCPTITIPIPQDITEAEVLIDITSVAEQAQEVFPMGEFMVNNYAQCMNYIQTLEKLRPTSSETGLIETLAENMYKKVPEEMELMAIPDLTTANSIDFITCSIGSMEFLGAYSKKYTES